MIFAIVLLCVCCILLGAIGGKPFGWFAAGLAVVALLVLLVHALGVR